LPEREIPMERCVEARLGGMEPSERTEPDVRPGGRHHPLACHLGLDQRLGEDAGVSSSPQSRLLWRSATMTQARRSLNRTEFDGDRVS
jgi:hypothetical protein